MHLPFFNYENAKILMNNCLYKEPYTPRQHISKFYLYLMNYMCKDICTSLDVASAGPSINPSVGSGLRQAVCKSGWQMDAIFLNASGGLGKEEHTCYSSCCWAENLRIDRILVLKFRCHQTA